VFYLGSWGGPYIRAMSTWLSTILVLAVALSAPGPQDDRAARAVDRAAEALGGWDRLAKLPPVLVEGRGYEDLSADNQGLAPGVETRRDHEERFAADRSRSAVAYERRTPRNDFSLRWRRWIVSGDERIFVDLDGKRARRLGAAGVERDRAGYMRRFPHLLLAEIGTRRDGLAWVGTERVDGAPCDVVSWRAASGESVSLAVDAKTGLVRRVSSRLHLPTLGDTTVAYLYSRWRSHPDLVRMPAGHELRVNGAVSQKVDYTRVAVGAAAASELLDVPKDYALPPRPAAAPAAAPAGPVVSKVGEGVFYVEGLHGFNVLFVEFRDFVLAVEAPEVAWSLDTIPANALHSATSPTDDYLRLVEATVPGKPVRYVVLTHHHGDHCGGVRSFLAAGATVLATPETARLVERMAAAPHTIRPDRFRSGTRPRVEAVRDRRVVTDGERTVEVLSVGRNPHTHENLLVNIPAAKIVYQGDLFYFAEGAPFPPRARVTMNRWFAKWAASRGLAIERIYGTHNDGAATAEHLAHMLQS
jgi:glyoxylase-like metal-dependent hydrolase (beta-lactamase superfamily II)